MKAYQYILTKQIQWAKSHGFTLYGSKGTRGRPAYTATIDGNLFEPLLGKNRVSFSNADGREVPKELSDPGNKRNPSKMQAVHSSSALSVNIFQYWQRIEQIPHMAAACGFCRRNNRHASRITFEEKLQISPAFRFGPNIDVKIDNQNKRTPVYAIECKFTEAYSAYTHGGLDLKYLGLSDIWDEIPETKRLAKKIGPTDAIFSYLHAAQLIKHILALKLEYGISNFRLLYLWYDTIGNEGWLHRQDIQKFSDIVKKDGIWFRALSFQELIVRLAAVDYISHAKYIDYISSRYL